MRLEEKVRLKRVFALILEFLGYSGVGVLAHEAGHLTFNNFLGGSGKIYYDPTLTYGHMEWATLPPDLIWLVYLGGGIFAAAWLFLFHWLPPRLTPSKQDVYVEGAAAGNILVNLFYAPTEVILYFCGQSLFEWQFLLGYLLGVGIFAAMYIRKLIKWIDRPNGR